MRRNVAKGRINEPTKSRDEGGEEYFVCYLSHAMKRSQAPDRADKRILSFFIDDEAPVYYTSSLWEDGSVVYKVV